MAVGRHVALSCVCGDKDACSPCGGAPLLFAGTALNWHLSLVTAGVLTVGTLAGCWCVLAEPHNCLHRTQQGSAVLPPPMGTQGEHARRPAAELPWGGSGLQALATDTPRWGRAQAEDIDADEDSDDDGVEVVYEESDDAGPIEGAWGSDEYVDGNGVALGEARPRPQSRWNPNSELLRGSLEPVCGKAVAVLGMPQLCRSCSKRICHGQCANGQSARCTGGGCAADGLVLHHARRRRRRRGP